MVVADSSACQGWLEEQAPTILVPSRVGPSAAPVEGTHCSEVRRFHLPAAIFIALTIRCHQGRSMASPGFRKLGNSREHPNCVLRP